MTQRDYILLSILALGAFLAMAAFQSTPGYMDADYYFATGIQLAKGRGFTEPFLWNYLDDPAGLPHPSHAYWMPLASLLSALGMTIVGQTTYAAGRWPFILSATLIPPLTARLAFDLTSRRDLAWTSGLLAAFPTFYAPYLTVTETFSPLMLLGALFFLALSSHRRALALGILAGLFHLARADGALWLPLAVWSIFLSPRAGLRETGKGVLLVIGGYLLIMGPWMARNLIAFGTPLAPGGTRALWLTRYDDLFAYPASRLTFQAWLERGLPAAAHDRLWAFGIHTQTALAVQGSIFLFPLILIGALSLRSDRRVRLGGVAWGLILGTMTLIFPFAGARGGFFHSGAALQPLWWALAPLGLDRFVDWGVRRRGWAQGEARRIFQSAMAGLAAILTIFILYHRVIGPHPAQPRWDASARRYTHVEATLQSLGIPPQTTVVVSNPPGYFLISGRPAIALPDGPPEALIAVAARYGARYALLDPTSTPRDLMPLLSENFLDPRFTLLVTADDVAILAIQTP